MFILEKLNKANKKKVIIIAVVSVSVLALAIGLLAAHQKIRQARSAKAYGNIDSFGQMMGRGKYIYPPTEDQNQFVLPEDAAKSGELALIVDDLDGARNGVAAAAAKNGGSVYATSISYASNSVKNGSMVVQIPVGNFDAAFSDLKRIGSQVVQESTRQIPQRNIYPYPMPLGAESTVPEQSETPNNSPVSSVAADSGQVASSGSASVSSGSATASPTSIGMPIYYQQPAQDKGYIKVIFVDYGSGGYISSRINAANMMGLGYGGLNMRSNLWVVLGVKSILLITLIVILVVVAKKIRRDFQNSKNSKPNHPVVRQMPKTRPRAVRTRSRRV